MRKLNLRRAFAMLSVAAVASVGLAVTTTGPASANGSGSYNNGDIATMALRYAPGGDRATHYGNNWGGNACHDAGKLDSNGTTVGGYGAGQCRTFVNCVVYLASGGTQYPVGGTNYFTSFLNAGAQEITNASDLVRGDIVQIGQGTHTTIIVDHVSGSTFDVVDSNYYYQTQPEMVTTHQYTISLSSNERAFRMGTVGGSSSTYVNQRLMGDFNGDGKADKVLFYDSSGTWWVGLSSGTAFWAPTSWIVGHGAGS